MRGRIFSDTHKEHLRLSQTGKVMPIAIREKIANAERGKPKNVSPEGRAVHRLYGKKHQSLAAASRRGVKLTPAQRKKIADAVRNAWANFPEPYRLHIIHSRFGRRHSEATKVKMRLYHQSTEGRLAGKMGALKTPTEFTSIERKLQKALTTREIDFSTYIPCENICVPNIQLSACDVLPNLKVGASRFTAKACRKEGRGFCSTGVFTHRPWA